MNPYEVNIQNTLIQSQQSPGAALRNRILSDAQTGTALPCPIKRRVGIRTLLVAAVLATMLVTMAFAAGGHIIQLFGGGTISIGDNFAKVENLPGEPDFAVVKDGRILFMADGSEADITELCSEEKYFQYEQIRDDGYRHVIIIGGTPDTLGWAEFIWDNDRTFQYTNAETGEEYNPAWYIAAKEAFGFSELET